MTKEDDPRLVFVPIETAIKPPGGIIMHLVKRWWSMHPQKGIIFWRPDKKVRYPGFPQCNSQETLARDICNRLYPWAEVRFLESVFYHIDPHDY